MLPVAMLLAVAAPATDRQAELNRVVFEVCPRVREGSVALSDAAQVAAIGFVPTAPRRTPGGEVPRAEKGEGATKIVLAGQKRGEERQCSVWFGGPDNKTMLKGLIRRAKADGFVKGASLRLGDGTPIYKLVSTRSLPYSLTVIEADAGGELTMRPATTIIYLDEKVN